MEWILNNIEKSPVLALPFVGLFYKLWDAEKKLRIADKAEAEKKTSEQSRQINSLIELCRRQQESHIAQQNETIRKLLQASANGPASE